MKSILFRMMVDTVGKAHNCQHNARHRLVKGDKRLKFQAKRSPEHFCVDCARRMIAQARSKLDELERQLQ